MAKKTRGQGGPGPRVWHTSRVVQRCCFCKGVIAPGHEFGDVELERKGCRYCMEERKL